MNKRRNLRAVAEVHLAGKKFIERSWSVGNRFNGEYSASREPLYRRKYVFDEKNSFEQKRAAQFSNSIGARRSRRKLQSRRVTSRQRAPFPYTRINLTRYKFFRGDRNTTTAKKYGPLRTSPRTKANCTVICNA